MDKQGRLIEFDIIRIIAILAVIMIHVSSTYVNIYAPDSVEFMVSNVIDSISRFGVPFFLLISGTFMLDEERDVSVDKIKHKTLNLFVILIWWSAVYALLFGFNNFAKTFFYGYYHLWYLFFIIGLYLMTPILRLYVKKENLKYIYYLAVLSLVFYYMPMTLDGLFSHNYAVTAFFNMFAVSCVCPYYIGGWLIKTDRDRIVKYKNALIITMVLSLVAIIVFTQIRTTVNFHAYDFFYNVGNFLVFTYSTSLFILLKMFLTKHASSIGETLRNNIVKLSNLTLGVYLIHVSIMQSLQTWTRHIAIDSFWAEFFICYFGTVILSFILAYAISKIKYLNALIRI